MKINVTNLGPIKEATIELGGLTVFVGPNGTGKSYLAKVIYGLQQQTIMIETYVENAGYIYQTLFGKSISTVQDALFDLQQLKPIELQLALPALFNLQAEFFKKRLDKFFNADSNLFSNTTVTYSDIELLPEEQLQAIINTAIEEANKLLNPQSGSTLLTATQNTITPESLLWKLWLYLFWRDDFPYAEYFPAARSNFMLSYKEIYRVRANEHVGLETPSKGLHARKTGKLNRFDKPTEDFLSRIYELDSSEESPLASIANKLQGQLYDGDSLVVEQPDGALPDFLYRVKNSDNNLRLHLTSSMVTETSPLLVGFRYWVQPNSLVIIDEPESHLHPEAQKCLINVLAEAVNQGLQLILITHSPYILSCVNNLIKFGSVIKQFPNDDAVAQFKTGHPDLVAIERPVRAYHFDRDGIVKDIVLASGLIDEAEFTEPFDRLNDLYEAMRDIEWEHRE